MRYIKIYRGWRYNKIDKKTDTKINNKQTNWYIKRLPLCEETKSVFLTEEDTEMSFLL